MRRFTQIVHQYPLVPVLSCLLGGQLFCFIVNNLKAQDLPKINYLLYVIPVALLGLLLLRVVKISKAYAFLYLALTVFGVNSVYLAEHKSHSEFKEGSRYTALVYSRPRYRRPGEVELRLKILSSKTQIQHAKKLVLNNETSLVLCKAKDLPWRNVSGVKKGDVVVFKAKFKAIALPLPLFSYKGNLYRRGYRAQCKIEYLTYAKRASPGFLERFRDKIAKDVRSLVGNNERSGLILAMAFGFRDTLNVATEGAFKRLGIAHLLIVSGYQITIIFYAVVFLAKLLCSAIPGFSHFVTLSKVPKICAFIFVLGYVVICGVDASSLRAELALIFVVIATFFERGSRLLNAILFSLLWLSVFWPGCYLEPGVQLSYAALTGICAALYLEHLNQSAWSRYLRINLYATLFSSLVAAVWFKMFSFAGFIINPLLAPFIALLACKCGILSVLLNYLALDKDGYLISITSYLLNLLKIFLLTLNRYDFIAISLEGFSYYLLIAVLSFLVVWILTSCYKLFMALNV